MAVQKSRVTPSRRGQRRSHDALTAKQLATDPTSGETHLRHHLTPLHSHGVGACCQLVGGLHIGLLGERDLRLAEIVDRNIELEFQRPAAAGFALDMAVVVDAAAAVIGAPPEQVDVVDEARRLREPQRLGEHVVHACALEDGASRPTGDDAGTRGRGAQHDHARGLLTLNRVRNRALNQRHTEEVLLGLFNTLGDRGRHLLRLAVADANHALAVADDDQSGEAEATTTLDHLGDAVDGHHALEVLAFFLRSLAIFSGGSFSVLELLGHKFLMLLPQIVSGGVLGLPLLTLLLVTSDPLVGCRVEAFRILVVALLVVLRSHAVERRVELGVARSSVVGLLEAQRDATTLEVDVDDLDEDVGTDGDDLLGQLDVALGQLGDVHQALDALLDAHERAERDELGDLARCDLTDRVGAGEDLPRVLLRRLQRQRDALAVEVDLEDLDGDLLAHLDDLGGVLDVLPAELGDVHEAVHAAEVDERTEVDDRGDHTGAHLALGEGLQEGGAHLGLRLLEPGAHPEDLLGLDLDVARLAVVAAAERRLVDEDARVRQGVALALGAGGQQELAHQLPDLGIGERNHATTTPVSREYRLSTRPVPMAMLAAMSSASIMRMVPDR